MPAIPRLSTPAKWLSWLRLSAPRNAFSLLPSACAVCGDDTDSALCTLCRQLHLPARQARCACCAVTVGGNASLCASCLQTRPAFDATIAVADYTAPLDQLVLALKFGARLELAPLLAALLHERTGGLPAHARPAVLMPVPLGERRLRERGFNQALEIAKPLGKALGLPVLPTAVVRTRETAAQSLLHPDERRANISGAFSVRDASLSGAHVGVVDDVMTTGETLHALASALKQAGAARVTNFVFARTPPA